MRFSREVRKMMNRLGELCVGSAAAEEISIPHAVGSTEIEKARIMEEIKNRVDWETRYSVALDY